MLGLLLAFKLVRAATARSQLFGEAMMFVYYGYAFPLSTRIARGFYGDGIWSDSGFMRWGQISAVSWKEEGRVTLILIPGSATSRAGWLFRPICTARRAGSCATRSPNTRHPDWRRRAGPRHPGTTATRSELVQDESFAPASGEPMNLCIPLNPRNRTL